MADQTTSEQSIFLAAVQQPTAAERVAYLDEACAGHPELRADVEALLAAHERLPTAGAPLDPPDLMLPAGTTIGRYRLLEPIGEGGYGTVFMAEQTSPVHRKVALKIIKAGMDTRQVIARFEAERQALALMDHPNIAKVFDAGVTDTGRPYFVMELVRGTPITKYCDEHKLDPRQRLELFVQVCQAVQHAHQKGIIHRDIKPTNVLVAQYDGKPVPKVIDFGVAKATGQRLTDMTMFTGFGDVIGTPQYMSPEQAELNQLDVDTRSDIYSLGVLLYELLTGTTPLESKRVREAALLEVLRVIREEEPPRPSTRLTTVAELPSIAAQRGVEPKKLSGIVRGELDWIVMRALEKDRSRRYETANGFAMDVQRYLSDEPVHACPPSAAYRFRKFARRNRRALLAASAMLVMLLLLVAGLAVSNVRVARERNEKSAALKEREQALAAAKASAERAQAERHRAESNFVKVRIAVDRMLRHPATGQGEWSKLSPALRKIFSDETARYYQSLIQEGSTDPSMRYDTAIGYRAIGGLHSSAGEYQAAEKYYRQSIEMLESLLTEAPKDSAYRHQLAWSHSVLGATLRATTRPAEAQAVYERSVDIYEALIVDEPRNAQYPAELWKCYEALLQIHEADGADGDVRRVHERTERVSREWVRLAPDNAAAHGRLGYVLRQLGKLDEAVVALRKAVEIDPTADGTYVNLGLTLWQLKKFDEAAAACRKAIDLAPKDGSAFGNASRTSPQVAAYMNLGEMLRSQKKLDESIAVFRELIERDPKLVRGHVGLARSLDAAGKPREAIAAYTTALDIDPRSSGEYNDLAWLLATCSDVRVRDPGLAVTLATKAVELEPKNGPFLNTLGVARYRAGDWSGAIADLEKSIRLGKGGDSNDWFFLAMARWQLGERDAAREWYDKAVKWMEARAPRNEELIRFRTEAAELLGVVDRQASRPSTHTSPATTFATSPPTTTPARDSPP